MNLVDVMVGLALSVGFLLEFLAGALVCEVVGYDMSGGFLLRLLDRQRKIRMCCLG